MDFIEENYRQIFDVGATVFDIGAHIGYLTHTYLKMGASVVIAVEPHPETAGQIRGKYQDDKRVTVVESAVSSENGEASFYTCENPSLSSLNTRWMSGRFKRYGWQKSAIVNTVTLDYLIAEYGLPAFIKIDIEGGEFGALSGLSTPVNAISFEFVSEFVDDAVRCAKLLGLLGNYSFNLSVGDPAFLRFVSDDWLDTSSLFELLRDRIHDNSDAWGDIHARKEI